jgi:hypothetical protein
VAKIAADVQRIANDRVFRQRMFIDRAVEPTGLSLEEFEHFIRNDRKLAERLVKESSPQSE